MTRNQVGRSLDITSEHGVAYIPLLLLTLVVGAIVVSVGAGIYSYFYKGELTPKQREAIMDAARGGGRSSGNVRSLGEALSEATPPSTEVTIQIERSAEPTDTTERPKQNDDPQQPINACDAARAAAYDASAKCNAASMACLTECSDKWRGRDNLYSSGQIACNNSCASCKQEQDALMEITCQ